jgi:hypothetical protein
MFQIMQEFKITEDQIIRLMLLRERNDAASLEITTEQARLIFARWQYLAGRMSEGGGPWIAPKIDELLRAIDFAGGAQDRQPDYTGGGSARPANEWEPPV